MYFLLAYENPQGRGRCRGWMQAVYLGAPWIRYMNPRQRTVLQRVAQSRTASVVFMP
jgi:hypothetical protein